MDDIEGICSRLIILDHGSKALDDDIAAVKVRLAADRRLILTVSDSEDVAEVVRTLHVVDGVTCTVLDRQRLSCAFDRAAVSVAHLVGVIMRDHEIVDFELREPTLEDIVQRLFQRPPAVRPTVEARLR
jgi:ABC-2 type transport system ATP-binding protein